MTTEPLLRTQDPRFLRRWIRVTFRGWAVGFVLVLVVISIASITGLGDTHFPVGLGWVQAAVTFKAG